MASQNTNSSNIPPEILNKICCYLDRRTISECTTVCKSWKATTCRILYKGVVIDGFGVYCTKLILKIPPQERHSFFKYVFSITRLTLAKGYKKTVHTFNSKRSKATQLNSSDIRFSKKELIALLEALPNLEYLDMNAGTKLQKYLKCILKTDSKTCLTRIQNIPPPKKAKVAGLHLAVCHKYNATITRLDITQTKEITRFFHSCDNLLLYLGYFARLTHLRILTTLLVCKISTADIEFACPSLKELEFSFGVYWDDRPSRDRCLMQTISHSFNSNLEILSLSCPIMGPSYLKYITEYTPLVKALNFVLYRTDIIFWIDYVGVDTFTKFFGRLSAAKNASFGYYEYMWSDDVLRPTNLSIFFKLVNAFRGHKKPFCSATSISRKYIKKSSMNYSLEKGLKLTVYLPDDPSRLPDTRISSIGLEIINVLKVLTRLNSGDSHLLCMLNIVLKACPLLVTTRFVDGYCKRRILYMGPYFHTNKSVKARLFSSRITTEKSLRVMTAQNFIPSNETLQTLDHHLPNIKYVAFIHIPLRHKKRVVNLLHFKNLRTFFLDLGPHRKIEVKYAYICLHFNDGEILYFCYKEEHPFKLTLTSEAYINQWHWQSSKPSLNITIKCRKKIKLVFGRYNIGSNGVYSSVLLAEFRLGKLMNHISLNSRMFCHDIYLK